MSAAFRVAAVQTVSGNDVAENLRAIAPLVGEAASRGAQLVLLATISARSVPAPRVSPEPGSPEMPQSALTSFK